MPALVVSAWPIGSQRNREMASDAKNFWELGKAFTGYSISSFLSIVTLYKYKSSIVFMKPYNYLDWREEMRWARDG